MKTVLHKANSRGHANHGWLESYHSFSFANYYDKDRMNFGVLRVLNDDSVAPGRGFGTHPHSNMEIISIPLEGDLQHMDNMGNSTIIKQGDIQVMSAGIGVSHSEYNKNSDKQVKFLQIWIFPNKKDIEPRYDQISIKELQTKNEFYQILSPNSDDAGVWIHQDAWFHLATLESEKSASYKLKKNGNGIYLFILEGTIKINEQVLEKRDGFGLWNTDKLTVTALSTSKILLMEIPMM